MRTIAVFFYGLFMDQALLEAKGISAELRPAIVRGFALRIGERATLVPSDCDIVHGMLASLLHAELDRLYAEPGLRDYRPEALIVDLPGGDAVPALCYNLIEPPSIEEHNPEYAAKLRALAVNLCFPADYVASIR